MVFCENCKFFKEEHSSYGNRMYCRKVYLYIRSPISERYEPGNCFGINSENNCKYFEPKKSLWEKIKEMWN